MTSRPPRSQNHRDLKTHSLGGVIFETGAPPAAGTSRGALPPRDPAPAATKCKRASPLSRTSPSAVRISRRPGFGPKSFPDGLVVPQNLRASPTVPRSFVASKTASLVFASLPLVAQSESRVRASLPPTLLSSLEDLSSVAKNPRTKIELCNTKKSVQISSFLCLTSAETSGTPGKPSAAATALLRSPRIAANLAPHEPPGRRRTTSASVEPPSIAPSIPLVF